jgi:2-hydroxychromene-2-carboxylate isomerase
MFYYAGEWFWGVDRLFHLEQWLRDLGACKDPMLPFICPRPVIDVAGIDASALTLDFYPSLNSPYTAIIYDRTIAMARECGIRLEHKPVLPMIMRGCPPRGRRAPTSCSMPSVKRNISASVSDP